MAKWTAFPYDDVSYAHDAAGLKKHWARLHIGDAEPLPKDAAVLTAWGHFHAGDFQKAHDAGLKAGGAGITVANKAQAIYANYLEKSEKKKLEMFLAAAERAHAQQAAEPDNANAWYFQAYALGRYGQSISIAEALAQGDWLAILPNINFRWIVNHLSFAATEGIKQMRNHSRSRISL